MWANPQVLIALLERPADCGSLAALPTNQLHSSVILAVTTTSVSVPSHSSTTTSFRFTPLAYYWSLGPSFFRPSPTFQLGRGARGSLTKHKKKDPQKYSLQLLLSTPPVVSFNSLRSLFNSFQSLCTPCYSPPAQTAPPVAAPPIRSSLADYLLMFIFVLDLCTLSLSVHAPSGRTHSYCSPRSLQSLR
jgi:hypothetical protein